MSTRTAALRGALVLAFLTAGAAACSDSVANAGVGDCFDDPPNLVGEVDLSTLDTIDCAEPHDNEIAFIGDLEGGDEYPGDDVVQTQAVERCADAIADYVGGDPDELGLAPFPITPTEAGWNDGDRRLICSVYNADLSKIEGSLRDSAE
jgi:hypothetical protein